MKCLQQCQAHRHRCASPGQQFPTGTCSIRRHAHTKGASDVGVTALDLPAHKLPKHLAVICDGNARWARERGQPQQFGHAKGIDALYRCISCCLEWGIPALTTYGFSIENWSRGQAEVSFLMDLFADAIEGMLPEMMSKGVRLHAIGQIAALPPRLRAAVEMAELATQANTRLHYSIALSYTGRNDLASAAQQLARLCQQGKLEADQIDEALLERQLSTSEVTRLVGPPDLLLRTSGEMRLSNFLLWELAYTELYFTDKYWPDMDADTLAQALREFALRERRFGRRTTGQA